MALHGSESRGQRFSKSERGNVEKDELLSLREIGAGWLGADAREIARALEDQTIEAIEDGKEEKSSRLTEAILETADDMHRLGILSDTKHEQITIRHLGAESMRAAEPN